MGNNNTAALEQQVPIMLGISEVNTILSGLAELPYKVSAPLIRKVQTQAEQSLEQQAKFTAARNAEASTGTPDPASTT